MDSTTKATAAKIFAALSKDNLKKDLMAGLKGINDNTDSVKNVTLDDFEVLYRGSKNETLTAIFKDLFAEDASKNLLTTWPKDVNPKDISNITIKLTVSFKDYQNAFKEASGVYSIVSGKVTVSLVPGFADLTTTSMKGIYTVKTETPVVVSTADGNYSITLDKLASLFNLDGTTTANSDLKVTKKTDTSPVITISDYNNKSQTLDWPSLTTAIDAIDKGTGYADETAEQVDAEYFYLHFGTNKFLNNLHDVLADASKETTYGLKVNNRNNLTLVDSKNLTLDVTFTNYVYYFTGGSQQVTGNVKFVFENSESGAKETSDTSSNTFKATSFTVSSGELTLSDNLKNRTGATATFGTTGITGTIGDDNAADKDSHSSETQGIDFTLNGTTITGLADYNESYSGYLNEFILGGTGLQGIEITLDK